MPRISVGGEVYIPAKSPEYSADRQSLRHFLLEVNGCPNSHPHLYAFAICADLV
jgi:hypothetical protein